jgi:hypothetical protein
VRVGIAQTSVPDQRLRLTCRNALRIDGKRPYRIGSYDVAADGQRILVLVPVSEPVTSLAVTQNWTAAIKSPK